VEVARSAAMDVKTGLVRKDAAREASATRMAVLCERGRGC
jgi:hypothetical protein